MIRGRFEDVRDDVREILDADSILALAEFDDPLQDERLLLGPESDAEDNLTTLGVDSDQLAAAVIATEKMLNAIALRQKPSGKRS